MDREKPRVLAIAEAANAEWTSVPLVGWSHARALASVADVHIVTQVRNRDAFLRAGLREGEDFTAIDSEAVAKPVYAAARLLRGGKGTGWTTVQALASLSYYYFEHLVWKRFGGAIRAGEFDIVHRITPLSPTVPGWTLARRCRRHGVPFVIGPLNGGVPWPRGFDDVRRAEHEWLSYVRNAFRLLPGYRSTRRHAGAIVIGSIDTWQQMPRRYRSKCFYQPENAIDPNRFTARRRRRAEAPVRCVFVGRLVPYKGADMLLRAAAELIRQKKVTVEIIGDGPQRERLETIIAEEQIESGARLTGWIDHAQLQHRLAECDLLTFPSIREFGGGVVLEAMAVGLAPVVVNYGGPKELVTPECGWTIEIGRRADVIDRLRETLVQIVSDPSVIEAKSAAALRRAHAQFTWRAKAEAMAEIYAWLLGRRAEPPHWPMPLPQAAAAHRESEVAA